MDRLLEALKPLVAIADAYDANALDDEARKWWGRDNEHTNTTPPEQIELYSGRGGRQLLTLADCLKAREAVRTLSGHPLGSDADNAFHRRTGAQLPRED